MAVSLSHSSLHLGETNYSVISISTTGFQSRIILRDLSFSYGDYKVYCLMRCDAMRSGTFRGNVLATSSGLNSKRASNLVSDSEYGGSTFLRNVGKFLPNNMTSHPSTPFCIIFMSATWILLGFLYPSKHRHESLYVNVINFQSVRYLTYCHEFTQLSCYMKTKLHAISKPRYSP
jgi:hypothetical protein